MTEPAEPAPRRKKPFWKSKTFWTSVVIAAAPSAPFISGPISAWMSANPQAVGAGVGAVFAALRWVTTEPVGAKADG